MRYFRMISFVSIVVSLVFGLKARAMTSDTRDCENHLVPNAVAQAYLRLLEHYCRKESWLKCVDVIERVSRESRFINPFSNAKTDSLSIRLDLAFESLREQVDGEQWQVIQAGLNTLRERLRIENQDREQKSVETAPIFQLRQTDKHDMKLPIESLAWHEARGTLYVASIRGDTLFVNPVVEGKLADNLSNNPEVVLGNKLSWIQTDNRHFLLAHGPVTMRTLYIFELRADGKLVLLPLPQKLHNSTIRMAGSPVKIDGRDHMVATVNDEIVLFEIGESEWIERASSRSLQFEGHDFIKGSTFEATVWRGQLFVAGVSKKSVFVYKFHENKFIKLHEGYSHENPKSHLFGGSILFSGDSILIAAPIYNGQDAINLTMFDFNLLNESMRSSPMKHITMHHPAPAWKVIDGRSIIGIIGGTRDSPRPPHYRFFEWTGQELVPVDQYQDLRHSGSFIYGPIQWYDLGSRLISTSGIGREIHFSEHTNGARIAATRTFPFPENIQEAIVGQQGDQTYVAVKMAGSTEMLIFKLTYASPQNSPGSQ